MDEIKLLILFAGIISLLLYYLYCYPRPTPFLPNIPDWCNEIIKYVPVNLKTAPCVYLLKITTLTDAYGRPPGYKIGETQSGIASVVSKINSAYQCNGKIDVICLLKDKTLKEIDLEQFEKLECPTYVGDKIKQSYCPHPKIFRYFIDFPTKDKWVNPFSQQEPGPWDQPKRHKIRFEFEI